MNESTHDDKEVHEGTEALQHIADEVERERAERGRTDFDVPDIPEEQAMANAAAHSEENPDAADESREDHEPGADNTLGVFPRSRGVS